MGQPGSDIPRDGCGTAGEAKADLGAIAEAVVEDFATVGRVRNLLLGTRIAPAAQGAVECDGNELKQLLRKLVGKAVASTYSGAVWTEVTREEKAAEGADTLRIAVYGSGDGKPWGDQSLRNRFRQVEPSRTSEDPVDFADTRRHVARLGASLTVYEPHSPNRLVVVDIPVPAGRMCAGNGTSTEALRGRRILIIDDTALSRHMLCRQLMDFGAEVKEAEEEGAGIRQLLYEKFSGRPFGFVLLNQRFNGTTADEIAFLIRHVQAVGTPQILVVADAKLADPGRADLIDAAITTPFRKDRILDALLASDDAAPEQETGRPRSKSLVRVLLVTWNASTREAVQRHLSGTEYDLDLASNGLEAGKAIAEGNYEILLTELPLPKVSGFELTKLVRGLPAPANSMVISALTAYPHHFGKQECLACGMDFYLSLPITREQFLDALARMRDVVIWRRHQWGIAPGTRPNA